MGYIGSECGVQALHQNRGRVRERVGRGRVESRVEAGVEAGGKGRGRVKGRVRIRARAGPELRFRVRLGLVGSGPMAPISSVPFFPFPQPVHEKVKVAAEKRLGCRQGKG